MIALDDVDAIQGCVEDVMSRMGCQGDAALGDGAVEIDRYTGAVHVTVPHDADASTFCYILSNMLRIAGYSTLDVWIDGWNPTIVKIDEKEDEVE